MERGSHLAEGSSFFAIKLGLGYKVTPTSEKVKNSFCLRKELSSLTRLPEAKARRKEQHIRDFIKDEELKYLIVRIKLSTLSRDQESLRGGAEGLMLKYALIRSTKGGLDTSMPKTKSRGLARADL